ncbi:hypothetical protein B0A52_05036 [Exophiala mesophila]|uniref:Pheromone a factor receptor n=1 Tax=Exophiala mesophila TaxID=212818 RepID=A0A438N753_EXOME|nr:hypothetical protein B0A52_05036 [Exophiala mesophila]
MAASLLSTVLVDMSLNTLSNMQIQVSYLGSGGALELINCSTHGQSSNGHLHHFIWRKPIPMALLWTILVPFLSLLACLLSIPQIFVHIQTRNFAASVFAISSVTANFQNFINALIWPRFDPWNSFNGKILCDIEVKAYIGLGLAMIGAVTSILRQMAIILEPNRRVMTASPLQRYIRVAFEAFFCVVLPLIMMATHYVVQTFRYVIVPLSGCTLVYDNSWVSVLLQFIWPPLVCLLGSVYCILCIIRLFRQRRQTLTVLPSLPAAIRARYLRLFGLACSSLVLFLPLSIYTFSQNALVVQHPYSWSQTHPPDWVSRVLWTAEIPSIIGFDRWVQIAIGFVGFGFFGLGNEAIAMYKTWMRRIKVAMRRSAKGHGHGQVEARRARTDHASEISL